MIKVLLISVDIDPAHGWGNMTSEYCTALSRRSDVSFELFLPRNANVPPDLAYGDRIQRTLPEWVGTFQGAWHRMFPFVRNARTEAKGDLVHTIVEFPFALLARSMAGRLRIPYGVSTQGTYAVVPLQRFPDRWLFRAAVRDAAFVTAPSEFTVRAMRDAGMRDRPVEVIHNAVNFARFQVPCDVKAVRTKYNLPEGPVVLGVGALKERKGFDILIRAFAIVSTRVPRAHLVIAGDGHLRSHLVALAAELGLSHNVHVVGRVNDPDLVGLYQLCDVYAHLPVNSRSNFEGFGIVYLEASSCGKPVVASRSGGVPDAVLDGQTGLLVDERDPEAAAEAIVRILGDPKLSRRLGTKGYDYARGHQWDAYADRMVGLYKQAIEEKTRL